MDTPEDRRAPRRFTAEEKAEMVRLYTTRLEDGTWMGATSIARKFGTTHTAVYYVLKTLNIPTRDARESHAHGKACRPTVNLPDGPPAICACGCGTTTAWNQRKNRWNRYVIGHRFPAAPYKDADWLRGEYVDGRRTADEIGAECGVVGTTILRWLRLHGIPARDRSAARVGRQAGPKNPAWKGGVADWEYASGWKRIAHGIRRRDRWTCQLCGEAHPKRSKNLHVHHVDGDKLNNDPLNLVSVCAQCHPRGKREVEMAPLLREITSRQEGGDA